MLKARLKETRENEPIYDHEYWRNNGREDTLEEIIELQRRLSLESNQKDVGKTFEVLIEGESKRSKKQLFGRNTQNKVIIFDRKDFKIGEYVQVKVTSCTSATLFGETI